MLYIHSFRTVLASFIFFAVSVYATSGEFIVGGIDLQRGPRDLVHVSKRPWQWRNGPQVFHVAQINFVSGRGSFGLRHNYDYRNGCIGLSIPTRANWYESGMLGLHINGKRYSFLRANNETIRISKSPGIRGMAAFAWENAVARVTCTFVMFSSENRLYLEVRITPKVEVKSLAIRLTNYPSGFNRRPRHVVVTPDRRISSPGSTRLEPKQARWLFFSDADLDAARSSRAQGPSACVVGIDGLRSVAFTTGGYGIHPLLDYAPTARRMLFCFWEFPGRSNAAALALLQREVRLAQKRMLAPDTFVRPLLDDKKKIAIQKTGKGQSHETSKPAKPAAHVPADSKVRGR